MKTYLLSLLILLSDAKIIIYKQTPFNTLLISDDIEDTWITVPKNCIVLGASQSDHPMYLGRRFSLIKPPRKMYEYDENIEKGIVIAGKNDISDVTNYPDFSAQILGISISGILFILLFKLFG